MANIGAQREIEDALASYSTPFKTLTVANQNVQFTIDPQRGLTRRRYLWYSNDGLFDSTYFSNEDSGIGLATDTTEDSIARIHSSISGQYVSQTVAKPGMGLYIPDQYTELDSDNLISLTNGEIIAGAFWWDEVNEQVDTGIGFTWNTDGWFFFVKSNGEHIGNSPVPQSEFNVDPFDGTGNSGQIHNPPIGYVYNWPYTWYNEGPFEAGYLSKVQNQFEEALRFSVDGPSTETPNFPVQLVVSNNGDAAQLEAELGGMQYSTYGGGISDIEFRETGESRITEGDNFIDRSKVITNGSIDPDSQPGRPLVAIRREAGSRDVAVTIQEIESRPIGDDIYVYQWDEWNPDTALTGATFSDPVTTTTQSEESKLQTATQATDYTPSDDSILRFVRFFEGGEKNKIGKSVTQQIDERLEIGATRVITAVNDGDSTAEVDPFFVKAEESY